MDHNIPEKTKKIWNIVRALLFTMKKGIPKRKLMHELSLFMKRGKIVGETMINILILNNHIEDGPREYEFSCSNSPANYFPFHLNKRSRNQNYQDDIAAQLDLESLDSVHAVLERLDSDAFAVHASPVFSGDGQRSMRRQLRISDTPVLVQEEEDHCGKVDKAADDFIKKFYKQLKQQRRLSKEECHY